MSREPSAPAERHETVRQSLVRHLRRGPHTARELAAALRLRERDVVEHLEHLERSLRRGRERFAVEPPLCSACGYDFPGRTRLSRPGSCPRCRAQQIEPPAFRIEAPARERP